jgi:hypothetical protein
MPGEYASTESGQNSRWILNRGNPILPLPLSGAWRHVHLNPSGGMPPSGSAGTHRHDANPGRVVYSSLPCMCRKGKCLRTSILVEAWDEGKGVRWQWHWLCSQVCVSRWNAVNGLTLR